MKKEVLIRHEQATDICRKALKQHAVDKGLDPDQEILMSRWYLDMRNKRIIFKGVTHESDKQESTDGQEGSGASEPVSESSGASSGASSEAETNGEASGSDCQESQEETEEVQEVDPKSLSYIDLKKFVKSVGINAAGSRLELLEKLGVANGS